MPLTPKEEERLTLLGIEVQRAVGKALLDGAPMWGCAAELIAVGLSAVATICHMDLDEAQRLMASSISHARADLVETLRGSTVYKAVLTDPETLANFEKFITNAPPADASDDEWFDAHDGKLDG